MSVLFDQKTLLEENFDPDSYVRKLCEDSKIEIRLYANAQYPPGWRRVIEELFNSIKSYPIAITRINDIHSVLDVKFEIINPTKEVYVWRAIEKARNDSALICAMCGEEKRLTRRTNPTNMLCDSCSKNAGNLGKTQTWLDKY